MMKMKILNLRKKNPKKTDLVNVYQIEVVPKRNEMISLLKAVLQQIPPDTETAEDPVNNDLDFLEDPSRAEDDGAPAAMYDKPSSDEEGDAAFNFDAPGIVFQSVYTMSLYGHFI